MLRPAAFIVAVSTQFAWVTPAAACGSHHECQHGQVLEVSHKNAIQKASGQLAEKCSCKNASDCSCKKGQCKCKQCGLHRQHQLIESLSHPVKPLQLPDTAVLDARAGVMI